jgi:hypothetical protein
MLFFLKFEQNNLQNRCKSSLLKYLLLGIAIWLVVVAQQITPFSCQKHHFAS